MDQFFFCHKTLISDLTLFVPSKTPAPPEAKFTPFRNMEWFREMVLPMERYAGGEGRPRLAAATMVEGMKHTN